MKAKLVKFNDDGTSCKRDIEYLRRHPECGIPFIQDKPFKPDNPKHKFKPIDRNFSIDILNRAIPVDPDIPSPPPMGKPSETAEAVGAPPYTNIYLPQDYTNYQQGGRRPIGEYLEYHKDGGYARLPVANSETDIPFRVPRIGNDSYSHETPERFRDRNGRPTRPVGDVELEDFGAGVGVPNEAPPPIRQTRIRPIADPRDTEFVTPRGMTDEELIDTQIQQISRNLPEKEAKQVERSIRKGKGRAKVKPTEQEMFPVTGDSEELVFLKEVERLLTPNEIDLTIQQKQKLTKELLSRGLSKERINELLDKYEAYDFALEQATGGRARTEEERLMRSLRGGIREIPIRDSNLLPERQEEIELRPDTPLTRGRTDIAPGRTRIQKVMDRTAGRLPEELRSVYKSAQRNTEAFNENVRNKSLEAIQSVRARTTRIFGQNYQSITEEAEQIRMPVEITTESGTIIDAPEGNINIRQPATEDITGIRAGDLQALDFDPLGADYQETFVGGEKPKLTFAERMQRIRTGAFSTETGVTAGGVVGGVLIGFGVGELMKNAGVHNKFAIATTAGGAGGAGARILTMAGSRFLTRGATEAVAETATYSAIRSGTSILRGAGEGAIVGVALMPVDMMLNNMFVNSGMSHFNANLSSGTIVGGSATAITTIGLASLGAAPETLGASLLVGAAALAVTAIISGVSGAEQDRKEREAKAKYEKMRNELINTAVSRQGLLRTLPNFNYDFDKALNAWGDKDSLGIDDDTWDTFSKNSRSLFNAKPSNHNKPTPTSGEPPTGEQKRINDLFSQYITHSLIRKVCAGGADCKELKKQDPGELTKEEVDFLNDKTGSTWENQANMQVEMSFQEFNYTRKRIGDAQKEMLNAWTNEGKVASQLDPYIVETAQLDSSFRQKYDLALKLDAEQQVVDAYQKDQTKMEQLPKNVRDMANLDPEFDNMIHAYYDSMETTAGQLDISVPQLITLQGLTGDAQKDKYQEFQFDKIKQDPVVVNEAQEIAKEEDQVRGVGFYDIDQAFLETDPTAIDTWHPTDSQILQAHAAGMNLNEYVEYMHQLAMGEAGDYTKLPKYTEAELRASGLLDYSHFQDELQMAGYRKDLYLYNPETRQFTLNPNVTNSAIPSTQNKFISKYTPRYLLQARQEYADMIHGLNEKNQNEVDNYNANLMKELTSYGKHYDSIVANINDERLYQGRSDLLFYDVGKVYNENKIEFNNLSDQLSDAPAIGVLSKEDAKGRQLNETSRMERKQQAAQSYGLSVSDYNAVKQGLANQGVKNVTQGQINQAVKNFKDRQEFTQANPNLNTNLTDTQIQTLNQGGEVTTGGQTFASA